MGYHSADWTAGTRSSSAAAGCRSAAVSYNIGVRCVYMLSISLIHIAVLKPVAHNPGIYARHQYDPIILTSRQHVEKFLMSR